ncbi:MAG: hypothetical protein JO180_11165 [Gemmatirosa sp.]|nr:hypothetical protein [Gemmatirosa sp.]
MRECSVVTVLDPERPAVARRIAERIESDPPSDASNDNVYQQLRRLDALLSDPQRVAWERLPTPAPPTPRTGTGGGAANDRAEGEDRLNFGHYVQAFANLVDSPDTRPPLTIGIFGAWGSGKSFLLRHLTDEIERRGARLRLPPARAFGAWLRRRIDRVHTPPGRVFVYCVPFNAWEYNASDHIWPRLVRRVLDAVTRDARWHRRPLRWAEAVGRKLKRNFTRKLLGDWQQLVAIAIVGATLWWAFRYLRPDYAQAFAQRVLGVDTSDDKFSIPAIVGALVAAGKLLIDTLVTPLGGWVTAMLDDGPGYGGESDFVRAIRADLDLVDRQLVAEGSRVLILIDDLDRCEPDKAVEVLQAINLLLDRRSFVVCLGIDARVITAAVEKHYEELLGPAGITGYEYLDKIIQIPFRIPDPTSDELAMFVSKQLGDPTPGRAGRGTVGVSPRRATAASDGTDGVAPAVPVVGRALGALVDAAAPGTRAVLGQAADAADEMRRPEPAPPDALSFTHDELLAFREVAPFLRPNPRHVKRLVNVYALVRSLAELAGSRTILDDPAATVRWLTLCAQWPYAVRAMLVHLDAHGPPPDPTPGAPPARPPLRWLYDAVRPTLDPARRARFDHETAALERLVASSDGLSWSELAVLRAYTVNFNPALDAELRADVGPGPRRAEMGDPTVVRKAPPHTPPAARA